MRRAAVVLCLFAGHAPAQELIDYDLLFRQHAGEIEVSVDADGTQWSTLSLSGGVRVTKTADGYVGSDSGPHGAVGCLLSIYDELHWLLSHCPDFVEPEERTRIGEYHDRVGSFAAANAVPPRSWPELRAALMRGHPAGPLRCDQVDSDTREFVRALGGAEMLQQLDAALEVPRLPVTNPCL